MILIHTWKQGILHLKILLKTARRIGNNPFHEAIYEESIDIDTLEDFKEASLIFASSNYKNKNLDLDLNLAPETHGIFNLESPIKLVVFDLDGVLIDSRD